MEVEEIRLNSPMVFFPPILIHAYVLPKTLYTKYPNLK